MRRQALRLGLVLVWGAAPILRALAQPAVPAASQDKAPPEIAAELPGARLQGRGRLRFLGLHIYDIRLWTLAPLAAGDDASRMPLALELEYARTLQGALIAERSLTEMRRVGSFSDSQAEHWQAAMTRLFPDVNRGDRLSGVQRPGQSARFHFNGTPRGELDDAEFTRLFFGIWLSPRTSEPALRLALLGLA